MIKVVVVAFDLPGFYRRIELDIEDDEFAEDALQRLLDSGRSIMTREELEEEIAFLLDELPLCELNHRIVEE